MDPGFIKADSANLPRIDLLMMLEFLALNKDFCLAEFRNVKTSLATGFLAMRVGKSAALALGGGIILLQVCYEKGYIKINWDKVNRNLKKVSDKVDERISGEGPSWMDKAERFVDRKIDQAEYKLKKGHGEARRWYSKLTGNKFKVKEIHFFMVSFVAGIAIGLGTA